MKVLSLKQPWLWAITDLDKRIENRTWKPPRSIIGERIALHASKKDEDGGSAAVFSISRILVPLDLPRGVIVATAAVVGWFDKAGYRYIPKPGFDHLVDDKWFFGPIGWVLDDIQKLDKSIPCRGLPGLWDMDEALSASLPSRLSSKRLQPNAQAGRLPGFERHFKL